MNIFPQAFQYLQHAMKVINFKKKKNEVIKKRATRINSKIYYTCKEKFENKYLRNKKYHKLRDHCHYAGEYRGAVQSICNLKYSVLKKIPIVFHNRSNHDYHFIIKDLAEEL